MLVDVALVVLVVGMTLLLSVWASRGPPRWAMAVVGTLVVWLGVSVLLARVLPVVALGGLGLALLVGRTAAFRTLLRSTPPAWPIALQAFRIGVELVLFGFHATGRAPVQVTFEGRNLDILVGLTAPLVAWWVARGRATQWAVIAWNILGAGVLANTVAVVVTSTPGPLHLDWAGAPFTEILRWPLVWLPAFLAPLAVLLHVASLRQALSLARGTAQRAQS
jgi:hypothetical protein